MLLVFAQAVGIESLPDFSRQMFHMLAGEWYAQCTVSTCAQRGRTSHRAIHGPADEAPEPPAVTQAL